MIKKRQVMSVDTTQTINENDGQLLNQRTKYFNFFTPRDGVIVSPDCQYQQTQTETDSVQLDQIGHNAQIIFSIGSTVLMRVPA